MKGIYYGAKGTGTVLGPYHPDELAARTRAMEWLKNELSGAGYREADMEIFHIEAVNVRAARRSLQAA